MKIVTERRVDATIKDRRSYIFIVRIRRDVILMYTNSKSYNSLYYSDECDPVLIDKRLKGFSDNRAKFDLCPARSKLDIRAVIKSGSRAHIFGQFRPMQRAES